VRPLSPFPAIAVIVAATLWGCDAPTPAAGQRDLGPLQVVGISLESVNPNYPEHAPDEALNSPICQAYVRVDVVMPNACAGFTTGTPSQLEITDNTIRFGANGFLPAGSFSCGNPVNDWMSICLPALGALPPPPALPPGHYVMIVNGFTGGFDLP
jgi:hypothetical protein